MHPVLADRRKLGLYMAAALPLAAVTFGLLTRPPNPFPAGAAFALAALLAVVALALLLPMRYVCRALPVASSTLPRLVISHGTGAAIASLAWVRLGEGLAHVVPAAESPAATGVLYDRHAPALFAVGALLYLLAAALHYMLLAVEAARRAEQQSLGLAVLAREAEIKALKAQVHPHFLFNSLNSISALTATDPVRAREMCILLAEFFRRSLSLGDRPSVSLDEELGVARAYLAIERMRFGARLQVEEAVDEAARAVPLPPLLLQPLVENAIRHGIATRIDGGTVRLSARADEGRLFLQVENPFDPESPARPGVGLGLANVRERLLVRYGEGARLEAQRFTDHFRVTLLVPVAEAA